MNANHKGLAVTKAELRALLEFASTEEADCDRYGVAFQVDGSKCYARATNSRKCVEFTGANDGGRDGEYFVGRKFLVDVRKEITGKGVARLLFSKGTLCEAAIEENDVMLLKITSPVDTVNSQASFPLSVKALAIPPSKRKPIHCAAFSAECLKSAAVAALAVDDEMVEWFHPANAEELVTFRTGMKMPTKCVGAFKQNVTEESVKKAGAGDDEPEGDGPLFEGAEAEDAAPPDQADPATN